jgi:lipopolysaccharide export system permease protein
MPIIWRYLISHFLSISTATVLAFIAILLTMRLDEIAHYASLGAPLGGLLIFIFHQMFYILPIAIPLSCLIASFILIQRLSKTHELTALRSGCFSFKDILTPLLITAAFLSLLNFWVISELSTNSHLQTNLLKSELRSVNPLLLLHNRNLMRMKGYYLDSLGPSRMGEYATDVILALPSKHQQRLNLFIAKKVSSTHSTFNGQTVTLINSSKNKNEEGFDDLLIENIENTVNQVKDFSQILQKKVWTINNDYLQLPLLLIRAQEQRTALQEGKANKIGKSEIKRLRGQLNRSLSEITKRLSIAFAVFTFTLMGTAFGISISRQHRRLSLYLAIALTTLYLVSFFLARGVEHNLALANLFYFLPHAIILVASLYVLSRAARGIE